MYYDNTGGIMKKLRQSNFELMRIISMLFVVMWHVILHSDLYNSTGVTKFILDALILFGVVHINSFVIVTGYFQCDKEFKWSRFFQTFSIVWFYKALIALIFFIFITSTISNVELLKEIMPLDFRDYWYINCYLILYLLSPFINKLVINLEQKDFRKLLLLSFVLFSLIPLISNQGIILNDGYTLIQFVFMYLIGAYLKKYSPDKNIHLKNYSKNKKQVLYLFVLIFVFFVNFMLLIFSKTLIGINSSLLNEVGTYIFNNSRMYSNPLVIIQSISYFLFFSTMSFKSKIVNYISKYTLDVYLIHESFYISQNLYKWIGINDFINHKYYVIIVIIVTTLIIFITCIMIGILRNMLYKLIGKIKIYKKIKYRIKKYITEI